MSGKSVERSLRIIEWLAIQTESVSFSEVVSTLGLPKSSTLELLRTLVSLKYVTRHESGRYSLIRLPGQPDALGHKLGTVTRIIEPLLLGLVENTGESVYLAELTDGRRIRYFKGYLPDREIRYDRDTSHERIAHQVSSGIILLGGLNVSELKEYARKEAEQFKQPDLKEKILECVQNASDEGFAINLEGAIEGASGVAVPVINKNGQYIMAINVAGLKERFVANLEGIKEQLQHVARLSSDKIGSFLANKQK